MKKKAVTYQPIGLIRAINLAGSQSALANKLGGKTQQQHVSQWLKRGVPHRRARAIHRIYPDIPLWELNPEIWSPPMQSRAAGQ